MLKARDLCCSVVYDRDLGRIEWMYQPQVEANIRSEQHLLGAPATLDQLGVQNEANVRVLLPCISSLSLSLSSCLLICLCVCVFMCSTAGREGSSQRGKMSIPSWTCSPKCETTRCWPCARPRRATSRPSWTTPCRCASCKRFRLPPPLSLLFVSVRFLCGRGSGFLLLLLLLHLFFCGLDFFAFVCLSPSLCV